MSLSAADILIPSHCPVLGLPLIVATGIAGGADNSPTLDRIDPLCPSGYSSGNVRVISKRANTLKGRKSLREFAQRLHQALYDAKDDAGRRAKLIDHCCVETYLRQETKRIAAEKAGFLL